MAIDLRARLRALGLHTTADALDDLIDLGTKKRWSLEQLFEAVADREEKERARKGLERRMTRSRIGRFKPIADYDWAWPTSIARERVESAVRLDFLPAARNVVLVAPQGLGKTMIAQNIANEAVLQGHSVIFITAAQLLLDLAAQESARTLERRFRHYAKTSLLILDEVGYLAFDNRNADLLFQVVTRRYERKSLVLTTNLAFKDYLARTFRLCKAVLDLANTCVEVRSWQPSVSMRESDGDALPSNGGRPQPAHTEVGDVAS